MPIEPPGKITGTPIIRREESAGSEQKKKKNPHKEEPRKDEKPAGKVDIRI